MPFLALALLAGCPAADLGVELPPEGVAAISPEDLRRDTDRLAREGAPAWIERMAAMNATVIDGPRVCAGQGAGAAEAPALWVPVAADGRFAGVAQAADAAALISLAKSWDTLGTKPGPRRYCLGDGDGELLPPVQPDAAQLHDIDFRTVAAQLRTRGP